MRPSPARRGLLAGAARAFAENGVRGSTMQSIARAAGVAKGTLYNHFRTKDEVARALLAAELERLTDVASGGPPDQTLATLADELAGHPVLRRLAVTEPELLVGLMATDHWPQLTARLATGLGIEEQGAELVGRWLIGVVLQPGRSTLRHRDAARIAGLLAPGSIAPEPVVRLS
jgi:AcrR family transcriptional regulator